jgi:hypothetical protein
MVQADISLPDSSEKVTRPPEWLLWFRYYKGFIAWKLYLMTGSWRFLPSAGDFLFWEDAEFANAKHTPRSFKSDNDIPF